MNLLRLLSFLAVSAAAFASEPVVEMKPFRVKPSDLWFRVEMNDRDEIEDLRVTNVITGSAAEKLGIRKGDHLITVNGAPVAGRKRNEVCTQDGSVKVRGQLTFTGRRGLFQKEWSITVEALSLKEKKEPNQPTGPTADAAAHQ